MKKILSILLTALVLLTIAVSCAQDVTVDAQLYKDTEVFMLNGKYYATLQEAVNARLGKGAKAAGDNDGVIYLRKNAAGPGAVINDPNTPVTIDFAGYTYSFKDVTATQGSTTGSFGLSISGGSEVTLKGTSTMTLFDSTANLTMVYVSGSNSSLVIEDAPKMEVKENQYVFWATDGATLTIGKSSEDAARVSGGIAVTGTTISIKGNSVVAGAVKATDNATVFIESASTASVITNLNVGDSSKVVVSKGKVTLEEKEEGQIEVIGEGTVDNETGDASAVDDTNFGKNTIIDGDWTTLYTLQEALISENYGKTITLVADVDLSGYVWTSVGTETNPFRGTVDGNGHIIKNLKSTTGGFISCVGDGVVIKDLTLKDVDISGEKVGGFINTTQYASATGDTASLSLINCDIDGGSITSSIDKLGGLIGEGYTTKAPEKKPFEVTITGCDIRLDTLSTSAYRVGGLVGYASGFKGIMSDCSVTANPVATGTNGAGAKWVGGIFGGYGTSYCVTIDNIEFNGTAQSVVVPTKSANFWNNNVSVVDNSGNYLVGCMNLATCNHTMTGTGPYTVNELNEKAYAITCSANHYVLGEKTDPNYHNLSWSNDDGKLYYYSNGYMTSHTDAPTWAGTQYGVLASGGNQNTPMFNNHKQGTETGLVPMADSANPDSLLWLVVSVVE